MTVTDLSAHIDTFLASQCLPSGCRLVLAYSGGVDSEVLAYGLSQFAKQHSEFTYQLVHIHHGLSENADAWVQHCFARGQDYGLPVAIERVIVKRVPRLSLEAQARSARYQALEKHLNINDILLTAHHEDDQLETILLALKRGQGSKGLAAMGQVQAFANAVQMRPLLDVSREQIEAYAKQLGLKHIEDESNQDDKYDRNFLRLEIIPRLKARWPSIATTASRSAVLCAEQQAALDLQVDERLPQWLAVATFNQQPVFKLDGFSELPSVWQALLLRGFIESQDFVLPSLAQLNQIIIQLLNAKNDAKVYIRVGECEIRRFANQVYLSQYRANHSQISHSQANKCQQSAAKKATVWGIPHEVLIPLIQGKVTELVVTAPQVTSTDEGTGVHFRLADQGARLRLPRFDESISVRYQLSGQFRCHPHSRHRGRELKKLWQEFAVPPWERERVGFIFYGEQLVMAIGLWVEKAFCAESNTVGLQIGL